MATKGENKAQDRRAQRRAVNQYPGTRIGNKIRRIGYGRGLSESAIKEPFVDGRADEQEDQDQ